MARMGMDVDQVAASGNALKQRAADIDALVSKIDGIVRSMPGVWDGPDAQQFMNEWWPEHKKTLVAASSHVAGLGQSALNNAAEQSEASGTGGAASMTGFSTMPAHVSANPPGGSVADGLFTRDVGAMGYSQIALSTWAPGAVGRGIDVDKAYGNQCVDVINDYADHLYPGASHSATLGGGNAMDIYGHANPAYFDKVTPSDGPRPGDIICIGPNQYSSVGHVAVVERVEGGQVHVIQQNGSNPTGTTYRGVVSTVEMGAVQGYLRPKMPPA